MGYSYFALAVLASILLIGSVAGGTRGFGGVNHDFLPFLQPDERNAIINATAVQQLNSVFRIFIRGISGSTIKGSAVNPQPDVESSLGVFNLTVLDAYDDVLAAIYNMTQGRAKAIIVPHDANTLRGLNNAPCDVYCEAIKDDWQSFYTDSKYREDYKKRLTNIFGNYKSKNFGGKPWSSLGEVILGVDLQNEPWPGVSPIPSGEDWICDIADHLKSTVGLGESKILVLSGGISGKNSVTGKENFPDPVFTCPAVDVVAIHGAFASAPIVQAATAWANMLHPNMILPATARLYNKLVLVEQWTYSPGAFGNDKPQDIWYQTEALNERGIPWLYSSIISSDDNCTTCDPGDVNVLDPNNDAWTQIESGLYFAYDFTGENNFDWSPYLTLITQNPQQEYGFPDQLLGSDPKQGNCPRYSCAGNLCYYEKLCDTTPGYESRCIDHTCKPCTAGCVGMPCPCQDYNVCVNGTCQSCAETAHMACLGGSCNADVGCIGNGFCMTGICFYCTGDCLTRPCADHPDCATTETCEAGLCTPCTAGTGCLSDPCKVDADCKTGSCSTLGVCQYVWPENL